MFSWSKTKISFSRQIKHTRNIQNQLGDFGHSISILKIKFKGRRIFLIRGQVMIPRSSHGPNIEQERSNLET